MKIRYDSNNSGGDWWLKDKDWRALEKAGWTVEWVETHGAHGSGRKAEDKRWLGALACSAFKDFETPGDAMREFEKVTGQSVSDEGCGCCGPPHSFDWEDGKSHGYASGEECLRFMFEHVPDSLRDACR